MAIAELPAVKGVRIGHRGPVVVSVFDDWPNAARLEAVKAAQLRIAQQFGKVLALSIIPPVDVAALKADPAAAQQLNPDPKDREANLRESAKTGEDLEASTLGAAMVIMPRGMMAVMIRSFMGAMSLITRSRTPLQTFKELAPAVAWLETLPGASTLPGLVPDVEAWLGLSAPSASSRAAR
ncbi:MAG: hypothetical protein U0228_21210 [Myxococcaceae bacterium]